MTVGCEEAAELADAHRVLSLLAEAIAGEPISLDPVEAGTVEACALTAPRRSVVARETAEDRRRKARMPTRIDRFDDARDNQRAYRAVLLRQLGRVELGTHEVDLEQRPSVFEAPTSREGRVVDPSADVTLLWQLYGLLEDVRVGAELRLRYPGARRDLDLLDGDELRDRPALRPDATVREHTIDALARFAVGSAPAPTATAEMSAVLAWQLTAAILRSERAPTSGSALTVASIDDDMAIPEPEADESSSPSSFATVPDDDLELTGRLDALDGLDIPGLALSAELLAGLAAANDPGAGAESVGGASAPELTVSSDGSEATDGQAPDRQRRRARPRSDDAAVRRLTRTYLYDEWDYRAQTYRRGWCRVREIRLDGTVDGGAYADDVRRRHALLAMQVRRRFASITPNAFARVHRTIDGDELSTDAILDAVIERRRGRTGDERVYVRRERAQREVAAAFLLDMSRSTDHPVTDPEAPPAPHVEPSDPESYVSYWDAPAQPVGPPARRVIDVAKDSLVLMCDALETLGDLHAVYGFSGDGRANVEFFVAKDFGDPSGSASSARIAAMEPVRYTRMGPAIRHAARRLARAACRTRVLIVVSDGYPQDEDYGPDRSDREYGIADTAKALEEAERQGITTFCITIDPAGHDYLRRMCPEHRYLVLDDVHQLPGELEKVYRALTGRGASVP